MKVKFISTDLESTIQYDIIGNEKTDWDESLQKFCPLIEISVLGFVPKELLEEITYGTNNINAIDVVINLTNNKII